MVFRSAVDWWFYAVVAVSAAVVVRACFPLLQSDQVGPMLLASATALVAVGLPVWLLVSTCYRVNAGTLEVRYGGSRRILLSPRDRQGFLAAIGHTIQPA